jgi:uncharacterized protein YktB (UPF0637 family)
MRKNPYFTWNAYENEKKIFKKLNLFDIKLHEREVLKINPLLT